MNFVPFIGVTVTPSYRPPQKNRAIGSASATVALLALVLIANFTLNVPKTIIWTTTAMVSLSILLFGYLARYFFKVKESIVTPVTNAKVLQNVQLQKLTLEFFGFRDLPILAQVSKGYNKAVMTLTPLREIAQVQKTIGRARVDFFVEIFRYLQADERLYFKKFIVWGGSQFNPATPKSMFCWTYQAIIGIAIFSINTKVNLKTNEIEQSVEPPLPVHIRNQIPVFSPYMYAKLMTGLNIGEVQGFRITKEQRKKFDRLFSEVVAAVDEGRENVQLYENW